MILKPNLERHIVRTPEDEQIYSDTLITLAELQNQSKLVKIPLHIPIIKKKYKRLKPIDNQLFFFPEAHRESRMSKDEFYQGFQYSGEKNLKIISNFFYDYLERKQRNRQSNTKISTNYDPEPTPSRNKTIRSRKYRQKFRSIEHTEQKPLLTQQKPKSIQVLRETLIWKKKFLAEIQANKFQK